MSIRHALLGCLLSGALACASTASATRSSGDGGGVDVDVVVPIDPLDDPTTRVDCPPGLDDPCGPGRHCIAVGPGFAGICVRDGGRGGLCREGPLACDEAIECTAMWCDQGNHFGARTVCGERRCGLNEGCAELDGELRCLSHGTAGGYCRQGDGQPCDTGLRCDGAVGNRRRCGRPLGRGESCVTLGRSTNFCAGDTTCVGAGPIGTCQTLGGEGSGCRAGNVCDPGLECQFPIRGSLLTCLRPVPEGGRCDVVTAGAPRCGLFTSCAETGVCVREGAWLGQCRERTPRCDGALVCHRDAPVCARALGAGAACSSTSESSDCDATTACVTVSATFEGIVERCVPYGAEFGLCRFAGERCDPGLTCGPNDLYCHAPGRP